MSYDDYKNLAFTDAVAYGDLKTVKREFPNIIHEDDKPMGMFISIDNNQFLIFKFLIDNNVEVSDSNLKLIVSSDRLDMLKYYFNKYRHYSDIYDNLVYIAEKNKYFDILIFLRYTTEHYVEFKDDQIFLSPLNEATETIIDKRLTINKNYVPYCPDQTKSFNYGNRKRLEILDPITKNPISDELIVTVKNIHTDEIKCFNMLTLYKHWLEQGRQKNLNITYLYANNPLTRAYFDEKSVEYVQYLIKRLDYTKF
jgi:hypothetical protein